MPWRQGPPATLPAVLLAFAMALPAVPLAAQSDKAERWRVACENGGAQECFELARAHLRGRERLPRNAEQAALYYRKACEGDLPAACQEYGEGLLVGADGLALDSTLAADMLRRACWDDPEGRAGRTAGLIGGRRRCSAIVEMLLATPPASREDSVAAKPLMARACQRGKVDQACGAMRGDWQAFPDSVPLPDSVKRILAAEAARQARLEQARRDSMQAVQDSIAGEDERRRIEADRAAAAARQNQPRAADVRRRATLRRSCDAGDAGSCLQLAGMMESGRGGAVDRGEAAALRRRACELDPKTCR